MKTIGIVGRKDSGKTHLVVRLIGEFRRRGLSVSTIKHTHHHDVELDSPGKDSFRHREAGAGEVIVASDRRWYLVHAAAYDTPPALGDLIARLAPCDLVLVEGYKGLASHPRVEVFRPSNAAGAAPLAEHDPGILALACPRSEAPVCWPGQVSRLDLDDTVGVADYLATL